LKWAAFVVSLRLTASFGDQMIVHSEEMKRELVGYGIMNVVVVPHGSGPLSYQAQDYSRQSILFFGFIRPSKGIDNLITAISQTLVSFPSTTLIIAGDVHSRGDHLYLMQLYDLVRKLDLGMHVRFLPRFIPEGERKTLAANSSILALPYTDDYLEVSGVVHDFSGYGLSLICSRAPRFSELRDGFDCVKSGTTPRELSESLCKLLASIELRERVARNLYQFANSESWQNVAAMRSALYSHILASRSQTE
jgi:glycosyltransferase involved in cell wall biosynthesis